jgi:hypothetical protein
MGRPLNKKYFGNRNIGTGGYQINGGLSNSQNYSDDNIGGEGVASYGSITAGTGWTTIPTTTFSAPNIPGGVSVAGITHFKALSFATTANGTGYAVGNVLEVDTGTQTTKARAPVASIVTVGVPTVANGGTLYDLRGTQNDRITFTHANLTTPLIVEVATVSGSTVLTVTVVQAGVWNGTSAPTSMANGVGGFTATTTAGFPGGDTNGNGLILSFPANIWGVFSFGTVSVAGDYTAFPSTGAAGTLTSITPATGTGAKADITMGLLSIAITEEGSGYINVADAAVSFSGSTGAAATAVLTTDSGGYINDSGDNMNANNQENAILIYAKTTSGGTVQLGDIIKQTNARSYKVKTADGIAITKLVAKASPAVGEATITATDSSSNTYYVTKLTAHKALLTRTSAGSGLFATGDSVKWTFSTGDSRYDAATSVTIANA